jgi:hypothetical protein
MSTTKSIAKLKRNHFQPTTTSQIRGEPLTSKKAGLANPRHIKSRSHINLDNMKLRDGLRSKLQSMSPSVCSPRDLEHLGHSSQSKVDSICYSLISKLKTMSVVDVVGRTVETAKALKVLGESDSDLCSLMAVVTKELDDGVIGRQVLERKLEQISRENYNLSKQLEAAEEKSKAANVPAYDLVVSENQSLRAKVEDLEAMLKAQGSTGEAYQQPSIRSAASEKSSKSSKLKLP